MLRVKNIDGCIFGSVWPWKFYKARKADQILYPYFVSETALQKLIGCRLVENDIRDHVDSSGEYKDTRSKDHKDINRNNITGALTKALQFHSVIINIDQYYVSHHYPDVYHVSHGVHSLLMLDWDYQKAAFYCIGVFPQFKGWISRDEIETGIIFGFRELNDAVILKYYYLDGLQTSGLNLKKVLKNNFIDDLNLIGSSDDDKRFNDSDSDYELIGISGFLRMFAEMHSSGRDAFTKRFQAIGKERWLWEIERPGLILLAYLESGIYSPFRDPDQNIIADKKAQDIIADIKAINNQLVLSFRKIYKYSIVNQDEIFETGMRLLQTCAKEEERVRKQLLIYFHEGSKISKKG